MVEADTRHCIIPNDLQRGCFGVIFESNRNSSRGVLDASMYPGENQLRWGATIRADI